MKIEMGESLALSWLKHIKKCQLVQLNWKVSSCWEYFNLEEAAILYEELREKFPVFKNNANLDQLVKQAELDALGISLNDSKYDYHAIDIAYHENGLNYGPTQETIERIEKKLIRSALVLYIYLNSRSGKIYFISPKINPAILIDLEKRILEIETYMKSKGFNFQFVLLANTSFKNEILTPLLNKIHCIADTSELFIRSIQLFNLCNNCSTNNKIQQDETTRCKKIHIVKAQKTNVNNTIVSNEMNKPKAIELCRKNGVYVQTTNNYASKNSTQDTYWINPNIDNLSKAWSIILNDSINKYIYYFEIPQYTFNRSHFKMKNDKQIDLQIYYGDLAFEDSRSGISFGKYLVKKIPY